MTTSSTVEPKSNHRNQHGGCNSETHSKQVVHSGRHRVLQTLLVLSMALLQQQKATSAVAAAAASTDHSSSNSQAKPSPPLNADLSDMPNGTSDIVNSDDGDGDDGFFFTTHDEDDDLAFDQEDAGEIEEDDVARTPIDVLIVSTADGSLMGLSKSTGELIWSQKGRQREIESRTVNKQRHANQKQTLSESTSLSLLEPLVTTTTTAQSFSTRDWKTAAVPSLDGKTVYLTAHVSGVSQHHGGDGDDNSSHEITVPTSIRDLVDRAPFVDNRGRIYNGSRSSVAVAVDWNTGEILKVISTNREIASPGLFESSIDDELLGEWDLDDEEGKHRTGSSTRGKKKNRKRNIVWMGRVDHTITIHEPRSAKLDVKFSAAEIKSVRDMILGRTVPEVQPPWQVASPDATAHLFLSAGASGSSSKPGAAVDTTQDTNSFWKAVTNTPSTTDMETCLVATPNGNLALRNPGTGEIEWVSPVRFDAPVAFALDADTGASLPVDIVPDAPLAANDSNGYLTREIHRQYNNLLADTSSASSTTGFGTTTAQPEPLVGTFSRTGQLFAIPLGANLRFRQRQHALLSAAAASSTASASALHSKPPSSTSSVKPGTSPLNTALSGGIANFLGEADKKKTATDLIPFSGGDSWISLVRALDPPPRPHTQQPPHKQYQKILRILGSWLPPTLAMIFVVSFELGRRKRQKDQHKVDDSSTLTSESTSNGGVIQVNLNVILGYGGHGTVVYEGTLEGRKVAVKRMLRTYHASADREISLLIESDGHPNVVRYFLKEVRGDFVYLALELCDLSLHELIGHMSAASELMEKEEWFEQDNMAIRNAVRSVLLQIACGVKHLHRLRIVHRDLKPANILLADSRKSRRKGDVQESIFEIFSQGDYVAKISDMGLGKQIVGQSSFGGSAAGDSSLRVQTVNGNGEVSSIVGAGPGSVGWQAPEVMVMRTYSSDMSVRSEGSGVGNVESNPDAASPLECFARTSRSVDIFSLGCIFYATLVPGSHPFGEWYEREANIMHNKPDLDALREISVEAFDLVSSMIRRNPLLRPTATQVCDHPYFWSPERRLLFLCGFSDRLENEGLGMNDDDPSAASSWIKAIVVERNAADIVGTAWDTSLDEELVNNVQRFRTYDPSSVRDLLRLIRNKYHHFEELPNRLKSLMGSKTDGLCMYFEKRFPSLLIHCFNVCTEILPADDPFAKKYSLPPIPKHKYLDLKTPSIPEVPTMNESPAPQEETLHETEGLAAGLETPSSVPTEGTTKVDVPPKNDTSLTSLDAALVARSTIPDGEVHLYSTLIDREYVSTGVAGDVIIWECSTAAKTFNNRGWYRSDDDWVRRTDASLRKPNINLVRCMDDPKFRTRLCNHWDASLGTSCPMRKKGKCVFAHGPVELRVKEAKRNRWGKLVDKNGDSKNPNHSGGEDTYGAARSIESERKQEGKWNVDKGVPPKGKKGSNLKKKESKSEKEESNA
ncbi:hypothetical protein ACA910_000844 [Epithemia clementina (nom. ined.)]